MTKEIQEAKKARLLNKFAQDPLKDDFELEKFKRTPAETKRLEKVAR